MYAHDYDRCFGPNRESVNWPHFFSMVSCLVYKPAWQKQPIREDLQYAEDAEWSKRLKDEGYGVDFAEKSIAMHSHNYTFAQSFKRSFGDSKAMAFADGPDKTPANFRYLVVKGTVKDVLMDSAYFLKTKRLGALPYAMGVRFYQRLGRWKGAQEGWKQAQQQAQN